MASASLAVVSKRVPKKGVSEAGSVPKNGPETERKKEMPMGCAKTRKTSRVLGFGTLCNFTSPIEKVPFQVPLVAADFNENVTVIDGGIAHFASAGPAGGSVSPVPVRGGDPKLGPWSSPKVDARQSLSQFSATLVADSPCAHYLKAQIVYVSDDAKTAPVVKTGIVRVSNPTPTTAIFIATPFQYAPLARGTFQVRFAATKTKCCKPCQVFLNENDSFNVIQYQPLSATHTP
jgi:hypothetical protein